MKSLTKALKAVLILARYRVKQIMGRLVGADWMYSRDCRRQLVAGLKRLDS